MSNEMATNDEQNTTVKTVTATKKVVKNANSLAVNCTRELSMLGLAQGDIVQITLSKVE